MDNNSMDHINDHIKEENDESMDMQSLLDSSLDELGQGKIYSGKVVSVDQDYVYVNIGVKSDGRVPIKEFDEIPQGGNDIRVKLLGTKFVDGFYPLSAGAVVEEEKWQNFIDRFPGNTGRIFGKIISSTPKGKLVDCNGITAFLPFSLSADLKPKSITEEEFEFVVKIDKKKKSVLVSRKEIIDEQTETAWKDFVAKYPEGSRVQGTVMKLTEFGAFVRVGGHDGLLHRNDMSWKKVFTQKKLLKLNEEREFIIISINNETKKFSLGLKQLTEDPWLSADKINIGDKLKGTVTNITASGVFIELENGIDGFVPNTEMSWVKSRVPASSIFKKGQEVELAVMLVNQDKRKIQLSYKQAQPNPWDTVTERYPVGSVHSMPVKDVMKFGLFVTFEDGMDGLVHVSDIAWDNKKEPKEMYKRGDIVEFKVLKIDKEEMRISCGIKQLVKSPWQLLSEKYRPKMKVQGEISGITKFGIFVKLEENVEGMVHISELSKSKIEKIEENFKLGDSVEALVLGVDIKKKNISLSIKRLDIQSEKEEIKKVVNEAKPPDAFTIGDMINLKENISKEESKETVKENKTVEKKPKKEVEKKVVEEIKEEVVEKVVEEVKEEVKTEIVEEAKQEVIEEIEEEAKQEVIEEIVEEVKTEVIEEIVEEVKTETEEETNEENN